MGYRHIICCGHVTGRACRCCKVVFAYYPLRGIEVHLLLVSVVVDTMLGLLINLDLRVVRSHMALTAVLGLSCLGH